MWLLRPRFTVRWLMVAVAVSAVALGAWVGLSKRRARFQRIARDHESRAGTVPGDIISFTPWRVIWRPTPTHRWHAAMAAKYSRLARYPWLPVAPDPPEPAAVSVDWQRELNGPRGPALVVEPPAARPSEAERSEAITRTEALVSEAAELEARSDWAAARRKYAAALDSIQGHRGTGIGGAAAAGLVRVDQQLQAIRGAAHSRR